MSDDDPNTPLDFPVSNTEYYPEDVEISTGHKQSTRVWAPETLEIMERFGYHPEDMDTGSEDEEEDSDQETDKELEEGKFDHLSSDFVLTQLLFFIILLFQLQFLVYRHASHFSRALSFFFRIPC